MGLAIYQKLQYLTMNKPGEVIDTGYPMKGSVGFCVQIDVDNPQRVYATPIGAQDLDQGRAVGFATGWYEYNTWNEAAIYASMPYNNLTRKTYTSVTDGGYMALIVPASAGGTVYSKDSATGSSRYAGARQEFTSDVSFYLFGMHTKSSTEDKIEHAFAGRCYFAQISDNGRLVRDMIPVKRLSDGICGLFDKITKKFYITKSGNIECLSGTVEANVFFDAQGNQMSSMESLVEKLNYANTTKSLMRSALVSKGLEVTSTDPFRTYVDKITNELVAKTLYDDAATNITGASEQANNIIGEEIWVDE